MKTETGLSIKSPLPITSLSGMDESIRDRFGKFVSVNTENSCWEWVGGKNLDNYGNFWYKGKTVRFVTNLLNHLIHPYRLLAQLLVQ